MSSSRAHSPEGTDPPKPGLASEPGSYPLNHKHPHPRLHGTTISVCVSAIISILQMRKLAQREGEMFQGHRTSKGEQFSVSDPPVQHGYPPPRVWRQIQPHTRPPKADLLSPLLPLTTSSGSISSGKAKGSSLLRNLGVKSSLPSLHPLGCSHLPPCHSLAQRCLPSFFLDRGSLTASFCR